ncbi:MAG: hypothetical protein ACRYFY_08055, partial [Janthinobacterium lividum]
MIRTRFSILLAGVSVLVTCAAARAQTVAPAPPAPPKTWLESITFGAQVEGGVTGNFDRPADGLNYGRLFDDK